MSSLLISFCNTFPQGFPLGAYNFATGDFAWLPAQASHQPVGGGTGVCWADGQYYALFQHRVPGWPSTLVVYGPDLRMRTAIRLERVQDGHSLIWNEGAFLVVSTGTNELIRVTVDVAAGTAEEESIWALGDERRDSDHFNSVALWQGRLCGSLHGPSRENAPPLEQQVGRIVDICSGETLLGNLVHPHSLVAANDTLYFLESGRGHLWSLQKNQGRSHAELLKGLPGYLRGLAIDGQNLFLASSAQRIRSKRTGVLMDPPHRTREATHCILHRVDLVSGHVESRDLTPFGREIYDVVVLPPHAPPIPSRGSEEAIIQRQLAYDLEHQRALDDLSTMIEQYEALLRQPTTT